MTYRYPYVVQKISSHYPHIDPTDISQRVRHSSFVDVSKRYLYFEVPKAACTQMKELLRQQHGAPPLQLLVGKLMETRRDMFVHARENVPLPSLVDLNDATQKEVLESDSFFRFTIVRNPYTRLVSAWKNKVVPCEPGAERLYLAIKGRLPDMHAKELITFDEFVNYLHAKGDLSEADPHWRRQVDHLFFKALSFSHVGKLENMSATLTRFQQHLGLSEPLMAGGKNVSAPVGLATYNQDLADKVYSLYHEDFERLGYDDDRDSWRSGQSAVPKPSPGVIPEARFYDEIIERNLIISGLYEERRRLRADLKRASRLGVMPLANALASLRRSAYKLASKIRRRSPNDAGKR
ncbi:MAG: sulfotransferase family protein [Terriglobales bacterium]